MLPSSHWHLHQAPPSNRHVSSAVLADTMSQRRMLFFNYFKHVPEDLVISSTPGMVISLFGTVVMLILFLFEISEYMTLKTSTTLVVDEFRDEVLRANFNVSIHQVSCEHLSIDVADITGTSRHNISKDILKWRLDARGHVIKDSTAVAARTLTEHASEGHETHGGAMDAFDPDECAHAPRPHWPALRAVPHGLAPSPPSAIAAALRRPTVCALSFDVGLRHDCLAGTSRPIPICPSRSPRLRSRSSSKPTSSPSSISSCANAPPSAANAPPSAANAPPSAAHAPPSAANAPPTRRPRAAHAPPTRRPRAAHASCASPVRARVGVGQSVAQACVRRLCSGRGATRAPPSSSLCAPLSWPAADCRARVSHYVRARRHGASGVVASSLSTLRRRRRCPTCTSMATRALHRFVRLLGRAVAGRARSRGGGRGCRQRVVERPTGVERSMRRA